MPLYDYKCPACGAKFDRFVRLVDCSLPQHCDCGEIAGKVLSAPAVRGDYQGYTCPVTGVWIEGRKAHEENLRRHGCRVLEPGEKDAAMRRREAEDAALDKAVEDTAERFITELPAVKRDRLIGEIEGGLTATVERQ